MAEKQRFSLWLTTSGPTRTAFQEVIDQLASKWNAPSFLPHITLLGNIDIEEKELMQRVNTLEKGRRRFSLELGPVQTEDSVFKSLYLPVCIDQWIVNLVKLREWVYSAFHPSDPLGRAENFPVRGQYMPHLSLMYKKLPHTTMVRQVIPSLPEFHKYFDVDSLEVWKTQGPVSDWQRIYWFSL
jgi:hypothetical protein